MACLKIGLFGGTFDPIHLGHINLALSILEIHQLDSIWFIPSKETPFKGKAITGFNKRLEMVQIATHSIDKFKVLDIENHLPTPSYSINTVLHLKEKFPKHEFSLILGLDNLSNFYSWKDVEKLIQLAPPLICQREQSPFKLKNSTFSQNSKLLICKGLTKTPLFDISSSQIRDRLKKKLYCKHLLDRDILDYIQENRLYCSTI